MFLSPFMFCFLQAQDNVINVSSIEQYRTITNELSVLQAEKPVHSLTPESFPAANKAAITKTNFYRHRYYLLKLFYDGKTDKDFIYFYAGKMVHANIYRYDSATAKWIFIRRRDGFDASSISSKISLVPLRLYKNRILYFIIEPQLRYYNWNLWSPTLIQKESANDFILENFVQTSYTYSILTIAMLGMMFMLFSYAFLKFYLNRRSEYLFNSLFAFSFIMYFAVLFLNTFYYQGWWHQYSGFFSNWLQALGYIWMFVYIIRFLQLRATNYALFIMLRTSIVILMTYCCVLPFIAFSDKFYSFNITLFNIVTGYLLIAGLITSIILYQKTDYLSRYVAAGLLVLVAFGGMIAMLDTILKNRQNVIDKIGGLAILYHAGILSSLFFQRLALGHKERLEELHKIEAIEKLKLENEKKELEKVLAIASSRVDERNRIAKEIHDDIGSGLTSIRLLSEIALVKPNNKDELNKISANANELMNNLNEIVWSINSKNDTLPNLLAYIRSHVVDYFEPYNIKLSINIPENIPPIEMSGEKRRHIFMVAKECFTNIVKHSEASAVNFTVQLKEVLVISIKDNGKGFDKKNVLPFKNGLRNMQERIESIGGEIDISGNSGTTVTIKLPLMDDNL